MNDRLGILIVAANPKDMDRLELREELTRLRNGMRDNEEIGNAEVLVEWAARASDLQNAVRKNKPHIVHFAGHGSREGIWLEDDEGKSQLLSKENLTLILSASPGLRLVVLNACATAPQLEALRRSVEFVVGTKCPVQDSVALNFTTHFYRGLAVGQKVRDAFFHAEGRVGSHGQEHIDRYQLFARDGVDESKPLIPPHVSDHIRVRAEDEISGDEILFAHQVNEYGATPSAASPEQRNENYKMDIQTERVKGKTIRFVGKLNTR